MFGHENIVTGNTVLSQATWPDNHLSGILTKRVDIQKNLFPHWYAMTLNLGEYLNKSIESHIIRGREKAG